MAARKPPGYHARKDRERIAKQRRAMMIFACAGAVALVFGVMAATSMTVKVDRTTGCPLDGGQPAAHTILLIDGTDPLSARELRYAEALVMTEYLNLPIGSRLTVGRIISDAQTTSEIVICRLPDRARRGDITVNDAKIRQDFNKIAGARLEGLIETLRVADPQDTSPILETLAASAAREDFVGVRARRLVVLSDFAQHSDMASDYDRRFAVSDEARDLLEADLAEVAVRLHYVRRPQLNGLQGEPHRRAWAEHLGEMGASDVVIGHSPNIGERPDRPIWTRAS